MFRKAKDDDICYECKDEVGEARPVTTLNTNEGIQILCKSCSEKLKRNVKRGENGALLLRSCAECGTIRAEDYKAIDDLTWLCISCYEK